METNVFIQEMTNLFNNLENKGFIKQFLVINGWNKDIYFIKFEALKKEDFPNGIPENGKYICFHIDTTLKKVERHSNGCIWLNETDKKRDKYKFYAMRSMVDIAEENGIKKFRKCKYKNEKDLFDKINNYFQSVMQCVTEYSNGYPYNPNK